MDPTTTLVLDTSDGGEPRAVLILQEVEKVNPAVDSITTISRAAKKGPPSGILIPGMVEADKDAEKKKRLPSLNKSFTV